MNRTDRHDATKTDRTNSDRPKTDRPNTDRSMGNVSHTHPYADRGTVNRPFQRGPVVAADGGERNAVSRTSEDDEGEGPTEGEGRTEAEAGEDQAADARMQDVDHTPPHDEGDGVNRVFERGGKEEPVENEE